MKVEVILSGEIVEAKRFRDLNEQEVKKSTSHPEMWDGDEIFIKNYSGTKNEWRYMFDYQVKIIEEKVEETTND